MSEGMIELTDDNFDETAEKHGKMIVDCWAEWCGPCKMIEPTLKELADEYDGKVSFAALDVDSNMETAQRFGIMAIPNLLFLRGTELIDQIVGVVPKEDIERKIAEHF